MLEKLFSLKNAARAKIIMAMFVICLVIFAILCPLSYADSTETATHTTTTLSSIKIDNSGNVISTTEEAKQQENTQKDDQTLQLNNKLNTSKETAKSQAAKSKTLTPPRTNAKQIVTSEAKTTKTNTSNKQIKAEKDAESANSSNNNNKTNIADKPQVVVEGEKIVNPNLADDNKNKTNIKSKNEDDKGNKNKEMKKNLLDNNTLGIDLKPYLAIGILIMLAVMTIFPGNNRKDIASNSTFMRR